MIISNLVGFGGELCAAGMQIFRVFKNYLNSLFGEIEERLKRK